MPFRDDLVVGKEGEQMFIDFLIGLGATDIEQRDDYCWDIKCSLHGEQVTFESKYDKAAERTGNAAIEISSRGHASGICSSKADFWVQIVGQEFYILKTSTLRYLILCNNFKKVAGGDDKLNEMLLIDLAILRKNSIKIS
jgi:hypothetical protein